MNLFLTLTYYKLNLPDILGECVAQLFGPLFWLRGLTIFLTNWLELLLQFGNLPYGFRANTWLIPPVAAQSPSIFPPLPVEDEAWGGNGGGLGRDGKSDLLPWGNEFLSLSSMPCKTAEERQIRDRKVFLLHSLFVDVAIFRAISAVHHVMGKSELTHPSLNSEIIYSERIGDLSVSVMKDSTSASCKVDTKIDGIQAIGSDRKNLIERNLLKGVTADENTAAQVTLCMEAYILYRKTGIVFFHIKFNSVNMLEEH